MKPESKNSLVNIDGGKAFDWGRTSEEYAKFRDIYPQVFYDRMLALGVGTAGQRILDLGTGTGVLPRNLYRYGAQWTGVDISENQIAQARRLSQGMQIAYGVSAAEALAFPPQTFDAVTACQCFWYFDHKTLLPKLADMLKPDGMLLICCMAWLPFEDKIAGESEKLVLKYSPQWSGAGEVKHPVDIPERVWDYFEMASQEVFDVDVPFTRETWHGRMQACRGVGASLTKEELSRWKAEHWALLEKIAPESFTVRHYAAMALLRLKAQNRN